MIDCDEKAPKDNIRNAIILKKWEGDPTDRTLYDLIPFLQSKCFSSIHSVNSFIDLRCGRTKNSRANEVRTRNYFSRHFSIAIATSNVEDIRAVLDFYRQEDDIIEAFKRNQARLREAEEARTPQQGARSSWSGVFGRGFSFGRSSNKSVS